MRTLLYIGIALLLNGCTEVKDVPQYQGSEDFPAPYAWVNDYVDVLSDSEESRLNKKIQKYKDETTNEIAIVFMDALPFVKRNDSNTFMTPGMYASELGNLWGVGEVDKDNGMIIVTFIEDREMFIANGDGTELVISDAETQKLVNEVFIPYYKESKHFKACNEGLDVIFELWAESEE